MPTENTGVILVALRIQDGAKYVGEIPLVTAATTKPGLNVISDEAPAVFNDFHGMILPASGDLRCRRLSCIMAGRKFSVVVAHDSNNGIGIKGRLPWRLSEDMKHFKSLTMGKEGETNAVIMGRKTWDSIPEKYRPLPGRHNVVISRNKDLKLPDGTRRAGSLMDSLYVKADKLFVIGGSGIYKEAIAHDNCEGMYITRVRGEYECDTFLSPYEDTFKKELVLTTLNEGGTLYSIEYWLRK